jgi:hypothetical protein
MKEGNCGSFFPQRKALEAPTNLLSLQCEEIRLIVKELLAHPLNGEANGSVKCCRCVIVKE